MPLYLLDATNLPASNSKADLMVVHAATSTEARLIAVSTGGPVFASATIDQIQDRNYLEGLKIELRVKKTAVNKVVAVYGQELDNTFADTVARLIAALTTASITGVTYNGQTRILTIPAAMSYGDATIVCEVSFNGTVLSATTVSAVGAAGTARTVTFPNETSAGVLLMMNGTRSTPTFLGKSEEDLAASPFRTRSNLEPIRNWRIAALGAYDSGSNATLKANLLAGLPTPDLLAIAQGATRTFAFKLPELKNDVMMIWESAGVNATWSMSISESFDSTTGADGTWSADDSQDVYLPDTYNRLQQVVFPAGKARWVRIKITNGGSAGSKNIREVALFELLPGRLDIWVQFGASLSDYAGSYNLWRSIIERLFPGRNAVVFNRAVAGEDLAAIQARNTAVLASVPRASFAMLDGLIGNDVTNGRPYSGLSAPSVTTLRDGIRATLDAVVAAGMVPILSNLSYREYTTTNAVYFNARPDLGSLPYNTNILDALREEYCPDFNVDLYRFVLSDPRVLTDTTHMTTFGLTKWVEEWVDTAFRRVYTGVLRPSAKSRRTAIINPYFTTASARAGINNLVYPTHGVSGSAGLVDVEGRRTPWQFATTDAVGGAAATGVNTGANSGRYPDDILSTFWFVDAGSTPAIFVLSNLDPNLTYDLRGIGSRANTGILVAEWTVTGERAHTMQSLDCSNNSATIVEWLGIRPTIDGKITIQVAKSAASTFGYINVIEITEHSKTPI